MAATARKEEMQFQKLTRDGRISPLDPHLLKWRKSSHQFQAPILARSLGQLGTSFGGFFAACGAAYFGAAVCIWAMLPFTAIAAGFLVRVFIIQHDCGHGSFFRSQRANNTLGWICSLLTLAPYTFWRRQHAGHHASWNNLDRRGSAGVDIYSSCLTVAEYRALVPWRRLLYRLKHHPLPANILFPPLIFLVLYRVPFDAARGWRRERQAVFITDVLLSALFGSLALVIGYARVAEVQLSIMILASIIGVWLFSIQHRFENTLWASDADWTFTAASLRGSSHLQLPRVLQWFTGNIGFHHVHHFDPRIPNYRLEDCHNANTHLQSAPTLTLAAALKTSRYTLWDADRGRMVCFPVISRETPA
jgi:omega-6 fatty acid desaturase (delta-12 desaturase)